MVKRLVGEGREQTEGPSEYARTAGDALPTTVRIQSFTALLSWASYYSISTSLTLEWDLRIKTL